jgi:hypothetical protein
VKAHVPDEHEGVLMSRILATAALLVALGASPAAAQTAPLDTYCLVFTVPADTPVTVEAIPSLMYEDTVTLVSLTPDCSAAPAPSEPPVAEDGLIPVGTAATIDDWSITVSKVDGDAYRAIERENMFNDKPPRDSRIVLITLKIRNETDGSASDPFFDLDWGLFQGDEDGFEEYDGILPRDLGDVGDIPAGRSGSGTIAFIVPKDVPLGSLVLYIGGDSEYGEWAIR